MRLIRLKIENWRGVVCREITLGSGVTIIEGPNEIGKSSLIEALQLLFTELDTTSKTIVKAVQPVGADLGSLVQAEFVSGPYQAVYTKRFNRQKATTLELHAPRRESLTGREAHERVVGILEETMDVGLWRALQVTQGSEVSQALIKDSRGLAKALDAAAGAPAVEADPGLVERITEEYTRYFTPRSNKPRASRDEELLERLRARRDQLRDESEAAEGDLQQHEQLTRQRAALDESLPAQRANLDALVQRVRAAEDLARQRELAQQRLDEALARRDRLSQEEQRRQQLEERLQAVNQELEVATTVLAQCRERIARSREKQGQAKDAMVSAQRLHAEAAGEYGGAERRLAWAREQQELAGLHRLVRQLEEVEQRIADAEARLAETSVTPEHYQQLERADREWRQAKAMLELGSPELSVIAGKEGVVISIVGEEPRKLEPEGSLRRTVSDDLVLELGSLVRIEIRPGTRQDDLGEREQHWRTERGRLMDGLGVRDLSQALRLRDERAGAEQSMQDGCAWRDRLLAGTNRERVMQRIGQIESRHPRTGSEQPPGLEQAECDYRKVRENVQHAADALDQRREALAQITQVLLKAEAEEGVVLGRREGAEVRLDELSRELAELRARQSDADLESSRDEIAGLVAQYAGQLTALEGELRGQDLESLRLLHDNASQVWRSANHRLAELNEQLAVLADRLQRTQVVGLFEQLSKAEGELQGQWQVVQSLRRRAAAAYRLYTTFQRHRDEARKAYVGPLKQQIDKLGRLVFGSSFVAEIDDTLCFSARILDGRVLSFEDLSVGAREQIGILMRLAAARLVAGDGGVPLILDDTLGFSDPRRLASMGAALALAGRDIQVLILTCTPGRFQHVGGARVVRLDTP
ncbi:MAG: AAA family ATPase [Gammaproteobacteria bacterium]|nr:AAA family ATPase [Gammaproteobacteria bacterium]